MNNENKKIKASEKLFSYLKFTGWNLDKKSSFLSDEFGNRIAFSLNKGTLELKFEYSNLRSKNKNFKNEFSISVKRFGTFHVSKMENEILNRLILYLLEEDLISSFFFHK